MQGDLNVLVRPNDVNARHRTRLRSRLSHAVGAVSSSAVSLPIQAHPSLHAATRGPAGLKPTLLEILSDRPVDTGRKHCSVGAPPPSTTARLRGSRLACWTQNSAIVARSEGSNRVYPLAHDSDRRGSMTATYANRCVRTAGSHRTDKISCLIASITGLCDSRMKK